MRHAVLAVLVLAATVARGDEIATLPLGEMPRALELASGESGQFLDLAGPAGEGGSRAVPFESMIERLAQADVVILGEHHTHDAGHRTQARILRALRDVRDVALGMEFFESEDDPALARYVAGDSTFEQMLDETGWYAGGGFNFEYYRPLVDACRERKAPVFGLNVPRTVVRSVSREGWDALTPEQKALVGEVGAEEPRHRFVVDMMMDGAGSSMGTMFDGMMRGQMAWDAAMARSILRAREGVAKGRLVVVIVGVGHSSHGLGIPARVRAADPSAKVMVVNPVVAEKPPRHAMTHPGVEAKATATLSRGFGDWAMILPDEQGAETHPTFGITLDMPEGVTEAKLASVEAGGPGARAGLRKGDVLLTVNGQQVASRLGGVRMQLASLRWGQRVELGVRRDGADLIVPVLLVPPVDGPGRWLESKSVSGLLDTFDPLSSRPVTPSEPAPGLPQARLVTLDDEPVRVDVHDGERLSQVWTLDPAARPVLGLLAHPAADGAVRIEIDRGPTGEMLSQRRIDPRGEIIREPAVAPPQAQAAPK